MKVGLEDIIIINNYYCDIFMQNSTDFYSVTLIVALTNKS